MTDLFLRIVELSWQAGVLALAVMLARLALRRAPKWAVCLLWALVAVRLVLPFSLQSPVSLQAAQSPVTAVQLTCVHETQEDSEPAVYTLLSSAELSVLSLPSDVSYKLYGADGSIRATLTEGAVIPLTEQDGGIGAEHAYVLQFSWLT